MVFSLPAIRSCVLCAEVVPFLTFLSGNLTSLGPGPGYPSPDQQLLFPLSRMLPAHVAHPISNCYSRFQIRHRRRATIPEPPMKTRLICHFWDRNITVLHTFSHRPEGERAPLCATFSPNHGPWAGLGAHSSHS